MKELKYFINYTYFIDVFLIIERERERGERKRRERERERKRNCNKFLNNKRESRSPSSLDFKIYSCNQY